MAQILILEDNYDMMLALSEVLELNGHQVEHSPNGRDGLALLGQMADSPDLIITDAAMPYVTGFEVIQQLKANQSWQQIPIVMVSGRQSDEPQALDLGADAFVLKPFKFHEFDELLDKLL